MNDLLKDEDIWGAATAPESPTLSDADIWGGSAPAAGEQNVLSDADIWGGNTPAVEQPSPVADRKIINGREYRLGKESGAVFDDKNKIIDDPQILQAFGVQQDPGITDYATELGRSTVRGVAGAASSAGKGLGVLTSDNATEIARVEQGIANLKNMSAEEATAFMRELPQKLSPAVAFNYQVAIRKLWKNDAEGAKPYLETARKYIDTTPVEEQALTKGGKKLEEATNAAFPQDPRFKGSITSDIGQAAGSSLFFLPIGLLTGGTGVAVAGAAAGAAESYDTARSDIQNGNFRDDRGGLYNAGLGTAAESAALGAGRLGALPGASEVVPTEIFLEQMPKYIPGLRTIANTPVWGKFAKAFGRVGTQVLSEGGQEAFQTWAGNLINQLKINPSQDISEDVLYNALLGGVVGGGMQTGVEGYNAVFGKDEPGPNNGGPINVSPPPGTPGGPRITPTLFPGGAPQGQQAAPPPGSPPGAPPAEAPISDDAWLMGAGYTPEQIDDMNPEERASAAEEARAQGVEPVDLMAGAPAPGAAPMAPRGTRRDRVNVQSEQDLEAVRPTVNAEPSEAQAAAGNYQKAHVKLHGFDVSIENPRGSVRRGKDEDGVDWASPELPADYGYIKRTTGKDGDHVDVYIGPNPESDRVYVIDQMDLKKGRFDEHKTVMGAESAQQAVDLYVNSFDNPTYERIGNVTEMSVDEFRQWVKDGKNTKRPAAKAKVGTVVQRPAPGTAPMAPRAQRPDHAAEAAATTAKLKAQGLTDQQIQDLSWEEVQRLAQAPAPTAADDFDSIFQQELDAEYGAPAPAAAPQVSPEVERALDGFIKGRKPLTPEAFASHAGISPEEAGRGLQHALGKGWITQSRNGTLRRQPVRSSPINVLDFIASIGGMSDPTGELAGMDLPKMGPFGPPVRKNGLHPDKVREALVERGYLTDRGRDMGGQGETTVADVYDLIARHMGGQRAYAPEDQAKADALETTRAAEAQNPDLEGVHPIALRWGEGIWNVVQDFLAENGSYEEAWSPGEINDVARMVNQGMNVDDAFERAAAMHENDLLDFPDIAPEITAAFERTRQTDMLVLPPFPDVEPSNVAQQPEAPADSDAVLASGEDGGRPAAEAEAGSPGAQARDAGESSPEAGSQEPDTGQETAEQPDQVGQWLITPNQNGVFDPADAIEVIEERAGNSFYKIRVFEPQRGKFVGSYEYEVAGHSGGGSPAVVRDVERGRYSSPNPDYKVSGRDAARMEQVDWLATKFEDAFRDKNTPTGSKRDIKKLLLNLKKITDDLGIPFDPAPEAERQPSALDEPAPAAEKGADAKEQLVIPGAERDEKGALNNAAKAPLKGNVPQKGMDVGLFGSERDQTDMFDTPAPKEGKPKPQPMDRVQFTAALDDGNTSAIGPDGASYVVLPMTDGTSLPARYGEKGQERLTKLKHKSRDEAKAALIDSLYGPTSSPVTEQGRSESFDDIFNEELDAAFEEKPQKANLQGNWWEPLMGGEEKPKKKAKTAGEAAKSAAKNTAKGMGEIVQGLEALFGNKNKLSSGFTFDEGDYAKALPLFKAAVTHLGEAVSDMREVVRALIKKFREAGMSRDALEGMQPYLKRFAEDVTAGKISLTEDAPAQQQGKFHPLVEAFVDYLSQPDAAFDTITEARKFAKDRGFDAKPGTPEAKDLDEKLELAIVLTARTLVGASKKRPPVTAYRRLVDLYNRQPNLGVRTSESMADQAYSTPAPLAFIASRLAGVAGAKSVMEPTAGNGMLLLEANPQKATVNELNDRRAAALSAQGFRVTQKDAATESLRHAGYPIEAIIENPPFGAVRDTDGGSKTFTVDGWSTTQIDHAIALNTLKSLADTGRAVLIVGSVKEGTDKTRSDAYNTKQKREFYWRLYQGYNVVDHFTVAGDLYKRQGAAWPVDVIVIEGRGKSARPLPAVELPKFYDTWEALEEKLNEAPAQTDTGTGQEAGGAAVSGPAGLRDGAENAPRVEAGSRGNRPAADVGGAARLNPEARGQAPVSDGSNLGEPAGLGEQQSREPDGGEVSPGARDERDGDRQPAAAPRERVKQEAGAAQQTYKPMSGLKALDTNIPTNMADAVEQSLKALAEEYGDLDRWIEKELGYKKGELGQYLAAEQVDAVALAIHNVKKNAAFIIGDQTGIGKGRVVASALRYAMRNRLVPIFVTEKPNLYGDIIRDLNDIGVPQMLGRDLKPFLTNAGASIPLDDEAVAWYDEAERAKVAGNPAPEKRGKFLRASGGDLHKRQMAALQKDGTGKDFDIIFTTYDQLNTVKGQPTDRRRLVEGLADRSFMVLDESHNAGGTEASERAAKNAPESRSDFLKKMTGKAKAVMFSSATYAKRPGVMALYARTDMGKAVEKPEMLGALIERGGVPMQQVVAAMLAKAGQYIRRERSFDGVSYDVEPVTVDLKAYEAVSTSLSAIAQFDMALKKGDTFKEIKENLKESAEAAAMDSGTGSASVSSTNFTSLMHNIVNQMLLAIKTDAVASRAIEALKAGEKPVITVANTMGAFLKTYAEENDLKRGDAVDLSFRDVLSRYLERTRRLTIKRPDNTTYHYMIPLSALPGDLLSAYREAERLIGTIDTANLPISPIDWLRHRIQKAGYRVSEITGRKEILEYGGPDNATFAQRLDSEVSPAGRRVNIDKFNRGDLDVMILNRAGSTGLSLHASSKFKDQRRRRMIIAQAELNIDVHMQMLGRVHRTGQVIPPAFVQAYADVPAEARPAAVLAKKMASLNANTTASRKSAFSADDSVDFLNEYGDQIAREYLAENPGINELLDVSLDPEKETARELTGRLLLLPVAQQRAALDDITARYKVLIENLDAMGENALEAKTIDLEAKTVNRQDLKPAEGDSPFTQAVVLEQTEVKAQGKALPLLEVAQKAAEALGAKITTEDGHTALNELAAAADRVRPVYFQKWLEDFDRMAADEIKATKNEDVKAKRREAHAENKSRFYAITNLLLPGRRVEVKAKDGAALVGVVMNVSRRGQTGVTGNPLALGAWSAEIAIPDNAQRITVPFSSLALPGDVVGEAERKVHIGPPDWATSLANTVEAFENARKTGKETRYIVTGNILAGFDQTKGQGQIINYTDDQGNVKPGILMSKTFSPKSFLESRAVRFKTAGQVLAFLDKLPDAEIVSHDDIITVRKTGAWVEVEMPAARQSGGTYFLNPDVRKAAYDTFTKVGSRMRYKTNLMDSAQKVLDAMMTAGAVFQTTEQQDVAEEIITGKKPGERKQAPLSSRRQAPLSSRSAESTFASEFMAELAQVDDLFQFPRSKASTIERVIAEVAPQMKPMGRFMLSESDQQNGVVSKKRFADEDGHQFFIMEDGDGQVWIDISDHKAGLGGSSVYAAVANYAYNTGKVFIGDPVGLSDKALRRRTEAMLSTALKFGTTRHIEPHPRQLQGAPEIGIPPLKWTHGNDADNVASLIEASTANLINAEPDIANARYDFSTGTFRDAQGEPASNEVLEGWASESRRVRKTGAGRNTVKRAILFNSLLRTESSAQPRLLEQSLRFSRSLVEQGGLQELLYDLPRQQPEATTQRPENPYRFVISQKQRAQITREIQQVAERILGHRLARVEIVTNQAEWDETFSPEEDAVYDPNTGIIYLALHGSQDLRSTLRHEAVHALRQAGVITAQEWAVLSRMAQTRWIDQYGIRDRYEEFYRERFDITEAELEQILIEEAIADAMADSWGKAPAEDVVSRIFARIKAFLEAVRNALRGQGFTTASQIIAGIEQGSMARRRPGTGQGRDILLYARQSEQAPLSSRRRLSPPQNPTPGSFEAPHDERVLRALTDSTDSLLNRLKRAGRAFGTEFRRKAQDREIDLLRTQNAIEQANGGPLAEPRNAYLAASLYPGRVAQRDKDLIDDVIEPLVKDIARRGLSLEEVNDFVMARHAIERNLEVGQLHKPGSQFHEAMTNPAIVGASGMSENEANDILNDAQASGKFADLEAVGDEIVAMNRRTLAKLYAEGLITQEQYDALTQKYQYYVPLRGWDDVTDDSHPDTPKTGRRYDVRGPEFQQALGRTSKADSPLAYSIMQARQAVIRIEKNRVGKRFLRLAQANPNAAFWEVNRVDLKRIVDPKTGFVRNIFDRGATEAENVYAVKVGGKRYNITLHHEGLLRAMKGIGGENMGDLVGVFHKINRFFAMMNTQLDPEFIFRNFLRDIQQAGIVIQEEKAKGLTRKILASIPKAAYGMNQMLQGKVNSQWARYAREFADAGGKIGFMDRADIELEKRNLDRLMKEATAGWTAKTLRAANEQTLGRLARYNDSIENTLRLSTYVALRQAGATKDRAAFVARELTVNFNRKGEWGPALNAFYLFYNASMQGAASLFMRLGRSRKMKMVAAGLIVEAFLMDMLNRMIGGDDDDDKNRYDKIPQEEKARNHIFMMPKWFEEKYGTPYYKVPLPLGWNWFNVIGQQASSAVAGAVTPLEAFGTIAGTFADSFNPLGSGDFLSTVTPTLLDPLLEIARNKDFFGENITPRQFDETTPYAERSKPNVNPAAKWLTDTFSRLTGGSPERSGAIDISPEWVEHLTDFALGGLGRFFTRSFNTVENWTSGEELDAGKIPFRRVFIGRDSTFADRDEYFQIRDAVHVTEKELRARIAEKNPEAAAEVRRKYGREIKMMNLLDAAEKQLAKLRKDYKAVKNAQKMGEEARARRLEALTQRMDEIQRKVRTKWHQLGKNGQTTD